MRLARERLAPGVDVGDHPRADVAADHLVPRPRELDGQRQPDLAQRDDDGLHVFALSRTVSPVAALRSTASAQTTVS